MGRLRAMLHAQPKGATRNATVQPIKLRVARPRECNTQQTTVPDHAASDARREQVLSMIAEYPTECNSVRYALITDIDADPDAVILAVAYRGADSADGATMSCEVRIPRASYDPFLLLDLIGRHGSTVH